MSERGDWFLTVSGRRLFVCAPDPEQIVIEDIAHALAMTCRFGGHVPGDVPYSVAQHSVLVSRIFEADSARGSELGGIAPRNVRRAVLGALLHDAAEAYLGDVIRPVKRELGLNYSMLEARWELEINAKFNAIQTEAIKHADLRALATERRDLLPFADPKLAPEAWKWKEDDLGVQPWHEKVVPLAPKDARQVFLARFEELST